MLPTRGPARTLFVGEQPAECWDAKGTVLPEWSAVGGHFVCRASAFRPLFAFGARSAPNLRHQTTSCVMMPAASTWPCRAAADSMRSGGIHRFTPSNSIHPLTHVSSGQSCKRDRVRRVIISSVGSDAFWCVSLRELRALCHFVATRGFERTPHGGLRALDSCFVSLRLNLCSSQLLWLKFLLSRRLFHENFVRSLSRATRRVTYSASPFS